MPIGMVIENVIRNSIADEIGLVAGDEILSINNEKPKDIIEYTFLVQNEIVELEIKHKKGEVEIIEIEKDLEEDLGVSFESVVFDNIKPCCNKCIFCFVDGQPEGLRESLYIKDDDWRLSYLQGTYVTLTNLTKKDWERICALRPSPLYVSIHTTNPDLRAKMLNNPKAKNIMEDLEKLSSLDIEIHAQIVLCPGYNDDKELQRTLDDLKIFKKNLKSLAVVPVGISKYRKDNLKRVNKKIALHTIEIVDKFNRDMKKNIAMASDEFFLLAEIEVPSRKYYGKFAQIEDGVGVIRLFLDDFEKNKKKLKKEIKKPQKLTFASAESAYKLLDKIKNEIKVKNLEIETVEVRNKFFGKDINVAGLLTGEDITSALRGKKVQNLVIPSVMLREGTEEFLDGKTVSDIKKVTGARVFIIKDCYSFKDILKIINSLK